MGPLDALRVIAPMLDKADIRYFVTGSMAAMMHGEFRTTRDIDFVITIGAREAVGFVSAFTHPDFWLDPTSVFEAAERQGMFNAIHYPSGLKLDFNVVDEDGYNASRFARRQALPVDGVVIWFASPEDVILRKLAFYQEGASDKHLRDIASIAKVQAGALDRDYIEQWAPRLGLVAIWNKVKHDLATKPPNV